MVCAKRRWVYGKTREEVHDKWLKLHSAAKAGAVATRSQTLGGYFGYWLAEVVVEPDYAPHTIATYEGHSRLYIVPGLGRNRLDKLSIRHVRAWLNDIRNTCQCCAQGKDLRRPAAKRRCCAIGACCQERLSERTVQDVLMVLRAALSNAVREELISKNVAALVRVTKPRKVRKVKPWSVEEARHFLEAARSADDPFYAACVMILVLGLRKGEVIGLTWQCIDLDRAELDTSWQLQRVRGQLLHRQTKTEASDATLPLPEICMTALRVCQKDHAEAHAVAGDECADAGLVFTTRVGTPIEPRNFNRRFETRCAKAGVRRITVHDVRHTCATLLAALDIHPRVAMRILRHAQIDVTMNVYTEVSDAKTLQALKRLGKQLGS
jgi:integrase